MIKRILQRIGNYVDWLAIATFFSLVILLSLREIADPRILFHIKAGEYILRHGIPTTEVFTCSMAGVRWVDQEWLFQVICQLFYKIGGLNGVIAMKVLWAVAIYLFLFVLGSHPKNRWLTTSLLLSVFLVDISRPLSVANSISLFLLICYVRILWEFLSRRWGIYVLVALQVLWVNSHIFFIMGPLMILVSIWAEVVRRSVLLPYGWNYSGRLSNSELSNLNHAFVFTVMACFLNPQSYHVFTIPVQGLLEAAKNSTLFPRYLWELQEVIGVDMAFHEVSSRNYIFLFIVSFGSFFFNFRKVDIRIFLFWLSFAVFSYFMKGYWVFFAFAAYWAITKNAEHILKDFSFAAWLGQYKKRIWGVKALPKAGDESVAAAEALPPIRRAASGGWVPGVGSQIFMIFIQVFLITWMVLFGQDLLNRKYYDLNKHADKSIFGGISALNFPQQAVDFITENNIEGNFFNSHSAGYYLTYRAYPQVKVYIDDRIELFGIKFFQNYLRVRWHANFVLFQRLLNRYRITGVFFHVKGDNVPVPIVRYLIDRKDWAVVYFNYNGIILLKNVPRNQPVIKQSAIALSDWHPPKLVRDPGVRLYKEAEAYYDRGKTLYNLGYFKPAIEEFQIAVKYFPNKALIYIDMGKAYRQIGDSQLALDAFLKAQEKNPQNYEVSELLAGLYEDLGQYDKAVAQGRLMIDFHPNRSSGYVLLAKILIKDQHYDQAFAVLRQMQERKIKGERILDIGDRFFDKKEYSWAEQTYNLVLDQEEFYAPVYYRFGLIALANKDEEKAEEWFGKAQEEAPDSQKLRADIKKARSAYSKAP